MLNKIMHKSGIRIVWLFFIIVTFLFVTKIVYEKYSIWRYGFGKDFPLKVSTSSKLVKVYVGDLINSNISCLSKSENPFSLIKGYVIINLTKLTTLKLPYDPIVDVLPTNTIQTDELGNQHTFNSEGLRALRDYSISKGNKTRIIFLGDSFTYGALVNDSCTLPYLIQQLLDPTETKLETLNLGVFSYDTKLEVKRLIKKGLKYKPDIVVLMYHPGDLINATLKLKHDKFLGGLLSGCNISNWEVIYKTLLKSDSELFWRMGFGNDIDKNVIGPLNQLHKLSSQYNFSVILVLFPSPLEQRKILKEVASDFNWTYVDLEKDVGYGIGNKTLWRVNSYDAHPSCFANHKVANYLSESIFKKKVSFLRKI